MNKYLKLLTVVMLLFVTAFNVSAEGSVDITTVTIEDVEFDVSGTDPVLAIYAPVYLDSMIDVIVEWEAQANTSYDNVEIEIEFDGDETESLEFDIESYHVARETFKVEISDDEDLLEGDYQNLVITMNDNNGNELDRVVVKLDIKRARNLVEIFDVNFRNGLQANAGEIFTASVGVANEGRDDEEDVYVVMSIPELSLTTRTDRFDLFTEDYVETESTDDDDEYKMYKQLLVNCH